MGRNFVDFDSRAQPNGQGVKRPCHDKCFIGNCFCCDCCVWAPLNPRTLVDPSQKSVRGTPKSCCVQFKSNIFFYLTLIILGCLDGSFIYFDAAYLNEHIHIAVIIVSQVLFLLVIVSLLTTACTDPGILPASTDEESRQLAQQESIPAYVAGSPLKIKEVLVYGQPLKLKFCYTCRFFRPPRAVHCSTCNVCVDNFDHHCPWIGNCVGRRNYRCFFLFLLSLASLGIFIGASVLTHLILETRNGTFIDAVKKTPASAVELVIVLLALWSVFGLTGLHSFLVMANLTTNEDIKGTFISRRLPGNDDPNAPRYMENPFSQGSAYGNCQYQLCRSRTTTRLHKAP